MELSIHLDNKLCSNVSDPKKTLFAFRMNALIDILKLGFQTSFEWLPSSFVETDSPYEPP